MVDSKEWDGGARSGVGQHHHVAPFGVERDVRAQLLGEQAGPSTRGEDEAVEGIETACGQQVGYALVDDLTAKHLGVYEFASLADELVGQGSNKTIRIRGECA